MGNTPNYGLPLMDAAASNKSIDYNEAMAVIDALAGRMLEDSTIAAPPASPSDGSAWGVPASATGDWLGQDGNLALFIGGGWVFKTPAIGPRYSDLANGYEVKSDGSGWVEIREGLITIIEDATTARIVSDADLNGDVLVKMSNALANTITINAGLEGPGPVTIVQMGIGQTSFVAGAGVTINSKDAGLNANGQFSAATLIRDGVDAYLLIGVVV